MDGKYFERGKLAQLKVDLEVKKDKKGVLKRIIANMTMGNDMSGLFQQVLECLAQEDCKKLVYLYLITYGKFKSNLDPSIFAKDIGHSNPMIRALAIKTQSNIPTLLMAKSLSDILKTSLYDKDPIVVKTCVLAFGKLYTFDESLASPLLPNLMDMLDHENPMVVANTIACLMSTFRGSLEFNLSVLTANKLISVLDECNEWSQIYIINGLTSVIPNLSEASILIERILPRLKHSNSALVFATIKSILYLGNFVDEQERVQVYLKLAPPLLTLLTGKPEIRWLALKNIKLILERFPDLIQDPLPFFCRYDDPVYIKLSKLDILLQLITLQNAPIILAELVEYSSEADMQVVKKAIESLGEVALKLESVSNQCVQHLVKALESPIPLVVDEAIIALGLVLRKYPNNQLVIQEMCEKVDKNSSPQVKNAIIWTIGQFCSQIANAKEILELFLPNFLSEQSHVQNTLMTAIVKLFLVRPSSGQELAPRILKMATEQVEHPDVRQRGFYYFKLLTNDPLAAKKIVFTENQDLKMENEFDPVALNQLLFYLGTWSSIVHILPPMKSSLVSHLQRLPTDALKRPQQEVKEQIKTEVWDESLPFRPPSVQEPPLLVATKTEPTVQQAGALLDLLDINIQEETDNYNPFKNEPQTVQHHPAFEPKVDLSGLDPLSPVIDPFAKTSKSVPVVTVEKRLFLAGDVEIYGAFIQGPKLLLSIHNKNSFNLENMTLAVNKNTFGLTLAKHELTSLESQHSNDVELELEIKQEQIHAILPLTQLQMALGSSAGIKYFNITYPLHILFKHHDILLPQWQHFWNALEANQVGMTVPLLNPEVIRSVFKTHRINILLEKRVDEHLVFITIVNCNETFIQSEIRFADQLYIQTRSISPLLLNAYHECLLELF